MKPADQWWTINGQSIVEALQRAHDGETPDLVYLELFASSDQPEDQPEERTLYWINKEAAGWQRNGPIRWPEAATVELIDNGVLVRMVPL